MLSKILNNSNTNAAKCDACSAVSTGVMQRINESGKNWTNRMISPDLTHLQSDSWGRSAEYRTPTSVSGWSWTSLFSYRPGRSASDDARYEWNASVKDSHKPISFFEQNKATMHFNPFSRRTALTLLTYFIQVSLSLLLYITWGQIYRQKGRPLLEAGCCKKSKVLPSHTGPQGALINVSAAKGGVLDLESCQISLSYGWSSYCWAPVAVRSSLLISFHFILLKTIYSQRSQTLSIHTELHSKATGTDNCPRA